MQLVAAILDSTGLNQQTTSLTIARIPYLAVFIHNILLCHTIFIRKDILS